MNPLLITHVIFHIYLFYYLIKIKYNYVKNHNILFTITPHERGKKHEGKN